MLNELRYVNERMHCCASSTGHSLKVFRVPSPLHLILEMALASLERAFAEHDLQMGLLKVDPHFDGMREEPRFQELMRKVVLPQ